MGDGKVKVGIIGSQFEGDILAAAFQLAGDSAKVVAVASPTPGNAAAAWWNRVGEGLAPPARWAWTFAAKMLDISRDPLRFNVKVFGLVYEEELQPSTSHS